MTKADLKGPVPVTNPLTDIRTQIAALMVAVNLAISAFDGTKAELAQLRAESDRRLATMEQSLGAQQRRVDSLRIIVLRVDALAQVKCVETRDPLVKRILECR